MKNNQNKLIIILLIAMIIVMIIAISYKASVTNKISDEEVKESIEKVDDIRDKEQEEEVEISQAEEIGLELVNRYPIAYEGNIDDESKIYILMNEDKTSALYYNYKPYSLEDYFQGELTIDGDKYSIKSYRTPLTKEFEIKGNKVIDPEVSDKPIEIVQSTPEAMVAAWLGEN